MREEAKEDVALKIPTEFLPKNWKKDGKDKFGLSISMIEKIVYGTAKNIEVFSYFLELAELNKAQSLLVDSNLKKRLEALKQ